jgi:microcystin-dependent protein
MTALTDTQVITASGGLVELGYFESASAVNLDPTTTTVVSAQTIVSDGSPLLLEYYSRTCYANNADLQAQVGFSVDGAAASTDGFFASPATGVYRQPFHIQKRVTLAAGSHTIAVQGFRNAGLTIMGLDGPMFLRVSKIVQATQWPALQSSVIVCTSLTRPAAPTVGTFIFETDTLNLYVWDGAAWSPVSTQPTGTITSYAGSTSPSGWLLCDGAAVSRTTYASLFAALSTTYGAGNGTTTFNVPDLRGRMPIGAGNDATVANNETRTLGTKGGDTRMQSHTHSGTTGNDSPDHSHATGNGQFFATSQAIGQVPSGPASFGAINGFVTNTAGASARHTHGFTTGDHSRTGKGAAENMQPFLVTNYIIKV